MSIDHSAFLDPEHEALCELPGFPYLRIEPILLLGDNEEEVDELWNSDREELLFSLHGCKGQFLVVSNHRIRLFKIPRPKGFIRGAAGILMGFVPLGGLSDAMSAFGDVKDLAGKANSFRHWVSPKKRRERAENTATDMPNPKHIKNVSWKTKDPEILSLISCYSERILLENAFQWKLKQEEDWRSDEKRRVAVHFGENGITLITLDNKGKVNSSDFEVGVPCGLAEIAEHVASVNLELLRKYGWTAESSEGVILHDLTFEPK